jgi:tetratricopeptide (TPR) repeat protein
MLGGWVLKKQQTELTKSQARKLEKGLLKRKKRSEAESRQLVEVYFTLGKYQQTTNAIEQSTKEYVHWQQDLPLLLLFSRAYTCLNQFNNALQVLEKSVLLDKSVNNAEAVLGLVQLYSKEFNLCKVEEIAPLLLKWQDYYVQGLLALIENATKLGDKDLLVKRLLQVMPYYQSLSEPKYIFTLMLRCGLLEKSQTFLTLYESHFNQTFPLLHARIVMAHKDYAKAVTLISEQETSVAPYACYQKALALDKLGEFSQAFDYMSKGAALRQKEFGASTNKDLLPYLKLAEDPHFIAKMQPEGQINTDLSPAFIFGFPRSGTTLLDNILDTQTSLQVMSEQPVLIFVKRALTKTLAYKYPEDLGRLTEDDLDYLRKLYFIKAQEMGFILDSNNTLIDKGPHHTIDLPFIKLLFPQAKLILSVRHPLDVCLSCFQQDFVANKSNGKLITLGNLVTRYQQVFLLLEKYMTFLELDVLTVKYEDLVQDFDQQISRVFTFLNYQPTEDYAEYYKHAAQKYVNTSSHGQTDKPLYTSSLYKWRNYAEQLGPYIPQLAYFIDKFGYDSNCE